MTDAEHSAQQDVIAFLMRPESYPCAPQTVSRIDTHGAAIFLVGGLAYKLKRAVKLAYLDFSTLAKRKAVCEREIALNKATAPQLYRALVPVMRDAGGALRLGGEGEPVEWLIEMARFDADALLDRLAVAGRLDMGLIEKLALAVKRFHAGAPIHRDAPWPDSLAEVVRTVTGALAELSRGEPELETAPTVAALQDRLAACRPLMEARRDAGFVRRCHGDLHLKNIVLLDGEPCLFDALEFSEALGQIDLLYDLAFLLMDLWRRGLHAEAHALFARYIEGAEADLEWRGLTLLPLFLSIRAGVRAMVGLDGLALLEGGERAALRAEIADYAGLAERLLAPQPPRLIALGGLSGTGKSTLARAIAPGIGAVPGSLILRTDVERKAMRGAAMDAPLGGDAYTPEARDEVYRRLLAKARSVLAAGHSVILDAAFHEAHQRSWARALAQETGAGFRGIWLEAPEAVLLARIAARKGDASDAGREVLLRQLQSVRPPEDWARADASGDVAAALAALRPLLA